MKNFALAFSVVTTLLFNSCAQKHENNPVNQDPLTSWNDGETKKAILNFVREVTDSTSDYYVSIPDRIAVFDNDGNTGKNC